MATTQEFEEAKSFKYKTSSINMYLNEREGFDPVNDEFHAELFKYAYKNAKIYNDFMTLHNGKPLGIECKHKTDDRYSMITPDASEQGRYRISYFDKQGFSSHQTFDSVEQSVEEMLRDGFIIESKGILSKLSQSPEFEIGNRVSSLIGQLNMGKITHQEFSDQRQAIHDDVKNRMSIEPKGEVAMNMIINDRGETVAAVGNEISIARAKARWPNLIEATHDLFMKYPRDLEMELINQIAAQDIKNVYEAQAVLDAAILPITESHRTYKRERIVIDPEKYSAMFAPTKFNIGDPVTYTNPQGVVFENKTISGIDKNYGKGTRYFYEPSDTPWYSVYESDLQHALTLDRSVLNSIKDAEFIIPIYAKNDTFFETVNSPAYGGERIQLSSTGKEQVYAFVLQSRMVLTEAHITSLETLNAHGDKGRWIRDIPAGSYDRLNEISMRQLDETAFDVNQKMLAHSLSGETEKYDALRNKYFLVKSIMPPDLPPSLCITKTGQELIETAHAITEKIIAERKQIIQDTQLLTNLSKLFPEDLQDQDGEVTINLVPPNGKDFYEKLSIRPIEDNDLLPPNSFHIKHYTASPATGDQLSDNEHIKHEFTFSVVDNKINTYWMQEGAIYHDALSNKSNGTFKDSNAMKQEISAFVTDMIQKTNCRRLTPTPDPQLYQFQLPGHEEYCGTYIGLGNVDKDNKFTGKMLPATDPEKIIPDSEFNKPDFALNYLSEPKHTALEITDLTVTNATSIQSPTYPALTKEETQELADFTSIIKSKYPDVKTENLHKLCNIASDITKYINQNEAGTLSTERFNDLAEHCQKQIKELTKDFPGTKVQLHYETETRAIILVLPEGSSYVPCSVPEIPKNKLELPQEPTKTANAITSNKR